jgi:hypothetical protein
MLGRAGLPFSLYLPLDSSYVASSTPSSAKLAREGFQSPNFETFNESKDRFQGTNSARLCSLTGKYNSPIPTRFLAPVDCLKIPALFSLPLPV